MAEQIGLESGRYLSELLRTRLKSYWERLSKLTSGGEPQADPGLEILGAEFFLPLVEE